MPVLARFNPFRNPTRFEAPILFDDLLRDLAMRPAWYEPSVAGPDMRVSVTETDKAYRIEAEMPGVDKEDIEVSIEGNQAAISAELRQEQNKNDEREIIVERSYGKAYRVFSLPGDIDGNATEARYDKGVLTLTIPRKENANARRIVVG